MAIRPPGINNVGAGLVPARRGRPRGSPLHRGLKGGQNATIRIQMRKMRRAVRSAPVLQRGRLQAEMPEVRRAKSAKADHRLCPSRLQLVRESKRLLHTEERRLRIEQRPRWGRKGYFCSIPSLRGRCYLLVKCARITNA